MLRFSGSYYEFGQHIGKSLIENNHDFAVSIDNTVYRRQLKIYKKYYPEKLEECRGIADTTGLPLKQIIYNEIAVSLVSRKRRLAARKGCTIFAVHENGKLFIGRNYDWMPRVRMIFEKCDVGLTGKARYFAFSDQSTWPGHIGHRTWEYATEDAINEHGLYIGLTFSHINKWNYGIDSLDIVRYIAENCRTVKDALKVFRKIPVSCPQNFLIADKTGEAVVVQHFARGFEVIHPDARGVLILTNHALTPKLKQLDMVREDVPNHDSFVRYAEAEQLITEQLAGVNGNEEFQFTDIWRILRQSHYVYNKETIWSLALELTSGRYNLYYDTAMGQEQEKFNF